MAALAIPALAARKMTVEQLQQAVSAAQAVHRGDDALAQQLADVKLTARLDSSLLQSLLASSPGPRTSRSLRALAADSIFLDPPAAEILAKPAPDVATQKAMLGQTVHYVARTLPKLPDFMATRVSEHFNDAPRPGQADGPPVVDGLYLAGTYREPIAFHDGQESDDPGLLLKASDSKKNAKSKISQGDERAPRNGMSSWGEFGPVLGIVLVDAAKGKLSWARWETFNGKPVAVFQFSVDRAVSHYNVRYCCVTSSEVVNGHYSSSASRTTRDSYGGMVQSTPSTPISSISGYHGHLTIDPETGVVLRITIEADLQPDDPVQRAAMMVEYAPVKIGDATYTCPVRSISLSTSLDTFQATPTAAIQTVFRHYLNDVEFTGYHRFGSESTLITDVPEATGSESAATQAAPEAGNAAASSPPPVPPSPAASTSTATTAEAAAAPTPSAPPAPAVEEEKEVAIAPVDNIPGLTADDATPNAASPAAVNAGKSPFTLNVTTRLVDISLAAYDKNGKPITDLKPEQIELYDNGRKQQIKQFQHAATDAASPLPRPLPIRSPTPRQPSRLKTHPTCSSCCSTKATCRLTTSTALAARCCVS
jgi:hypothetical protein